jgi:magnesium transporter
MQAGLWDLDALQKLRAFVKPNDSTARAVTQRYASSEHTPKAICKPPWHERLWGHATGKASKLRPEDLPSIDGGPGSMFSAMRTQASKAALEPRLRCTEVDEKGEVILVDGEFKKSELIAKVREVLHFFAGRMSNSTAAG